MIVEILVRDLVVINSYNIIDEIDGNNKFG